MRGVAADQTSYVIARPDTENVKVGDVAITYATQGSCPTTCPLYNRGCYAETGPMGLISKRLNRAFQANPGATEVNIAQAEAQAILALPGTKPLRLHGVGDCRTEEAARIVGQAAAEYSARFGQVVWTYTHAWRDVPRSAWGPVSVLASCENLADVKHAQELGYATALVVAEHPTDGRAQVIDGQRLIPCPQQTHDNVTCASCRLCWDAEKLRARQATITFAAHGTKKREVIVTVGG